MATDPKVASGDSIIKAFEKCQKVLRSSNDGQIGHGTSAGFWKAPQPNGTVKTFQVFVEVQEYSDELLKAEPDTGGLLKHASKKKPKSKAS